MTLEDFGLLYAIGLVVFGFVFRPGISVRFVFATIAVVLSLVWGFATPTALGPNGGNLLFLIPFAPVTFLLAVGLMWVGALCRGRKAKK